MCCMLAESENYLDIKSLLTERDQWKRIIFAMTRQILKEKNVIKPILINLILNIHFSKRSVNESLINIILKNLH